MQTPNTQPVPTGMLATEPAALTATITAAVTAVIALLVAYGIDLSSEQQNAILGVIAVAAPVIAGLVIRSHVYAPASVAAIKHDAYDAGTPPTQPEPVLPEPGGAA